MNKKIIPQSRTRVQAHPLKAFPELANHLAKISLKGQELYELTRPQELGKQLGISKQAVQYYVDKLKEEEV